MNTLQEKLKAMVREQAERECLEIDRVFGGATVSAAPLLGLPAPGPTMGDEPTSLTKVIEKLAAAGEPFRVQEVMEAARASGFPAPKPSCSSRLSTMVKDGVLRRVGRGRYVAGVEVMSEKERAYRALRDEMKPKNAEEQ